MKKIFAGLLLTVMLLSLGGCGSAGAAPAETAAAPAAAETDIPVEAPAQEYSWVFSGGSGGEEGMGQYIAELAESGNRPVSRADPPFYPYDGTLLRSFGAV